MSQGGEQELRPVHVTVVTTDESTVNTKAKRRRAEILTATSSATFLTHSIKLTHVRPSTAIGTIPQTCPRKQQSPPQSSELNLQDFSLSLPSYTRKQTIQYQKWIQPSEDAG